MRNGSGGGISGVAGSQVLLARLARIRIKIFFPCQGRSESGETSIEIHWAALVVGGSTKTLTLALKVVTPTGMISDAKNMFS